MSLINGIHHVSMKCCNDDEYNRVCDFYKSVLGLSVARVWDGGTMFAAGDSLIEVFTDGEKPLEKGVIQHFAFRTNDVDACVKAVLNAGYEVFTGPMDIEIPSNPSLPARMAFCYGPLGEEIEFFQEK